MLPSGIPDFQSEQLVQLIYDLYCDLYTHKYVIYVKAA